MKDSKPVTAHISDAITGRDIKRQIQFEQNQHRGLSSRYFELKSAHPITLEYVDFTEFRKGYYDSTITILVMGFTIIILAILIIAAKWKIPWVLSFGVFVLGSLLTPVFCALYENRKMERCAAEGKSGRIVFFRYSEKNLERILFENQRLEHMVKQAEAELEERRALKRQGDLQRFPSKLRKAKELKPKFMLLMDIIQQQLGGSYEYHMESSKVGDLRLPSFTVTMMGPKLHGEQQVEYTMTETELECLTKDVARAQSIVQSYRDLQRQLETIGAK